MHGLGLSNSIVTAIGKWRVDPTSRLLCPGLSWQISQLAELQLSLLIGELEIRFFSN